MSLPLTNKAKLVNFYKKENNPKVKERLLLWSGGREDGQVPFRVVKEMQRSNPLASEWLKRYDKEGMEGLKDRPKTGRLPELSKRLVTRIRKEISGSKQGWTTKQVDELIVKEKWDKISSYPHIPHPLQVWFQAEGAKKKEHVNTATREEKDDFKKRSSRYLWIGSNNKRRIKLALP